jgi:Asp-tRNA(Asn)/Glu-tRNA(Gln) amidotransferase A subunit family amidase
MQSQRTDLRYTELPDLRRLLDDGRFSAVELTNQALSNLAGLGRPLNAIAQLLPERGTREAEAADLRLKLDRQRGRASGALLGIPYGAKDIFSARGGPTTWGVPRFARRVIDEDAEVVSRLRGRGAVLAAKLATVEMAGGGRPRLAGASLQGQGRNPWNPARYSGGSSSGPGIAVALGLLPYALGTETGGSVLGPASFSGITGFRPTLGLIPRTGVMALSWTLDKVGVLARSAADCATVVAAIAGPDGVDSDATLRFRPFRQRRRRVRVGWDSSEPEELDAAVRPALELGLEAFRRLEVDMADESLHDDHADGEALEVVMLAEAGHLHRHLLEDETFELVDEKQLAELRGGLAISSRDYLLAIERARQARLRFRSVFSRVDLVIAASRPTTAPSLSEPRAPRGDATRSDYLRNVGNLIGLPGVSIPCGLGSDGLPVGLQLVGPPGSDALLLAVAAEFQSATDFHLLRPPDPSGARQGRG